MSWIDDKHGELLLNIKNNLPELEELLTNTDEEWQGEDGIYRFYHHSFKVCYLQGITQRIVDVLKKIQPAETELNDMFLNIVEKGINQKFEHIWNTDWDKYTVPITTAYFHAKYFLQMAVKYGKELEQAPQLLPTGWAAVLYLYSLR